MDNNLLNDKESEESEAKEVNEREWQEYIWSLKRVESVIDVDGKEYSLNFLPFLLE